MSIEMNNSGRARTGRLLPRAVSARRGGIFVAALLAVIGVVFAWQASLLDFGGFDLPGPGFLPLVLGVVVFALSTLIAIEGFRGAGEGAGEGETVELGHRDVLIVFAAMAAVAALFEPLGAYLSLGLFGAVLLVVIARVSVPLAVLSACIAMAACWYFFQVLLGLQLPRGPF
jgi:putative tricarboxylic transport membrane protein